MISYKPSARDPEGETIAHELRSLGYENVVNVKAGKAFFFEVIADNNEEALKEVKRIASETRLFNPNVHEIMVTEVA